MPIMDKKFLMNCWSKRREVTVVTKCGVFQGRIEDEEHERDAASSNHDQDCTCEQRSSCHTNIDAPPIKVQCEDNTKFICLRLTCVPGVIDPATGEIMEIIGTSGGSTFNLFNIGNSILINVDEICVIGPRTVCLTEPYGI